MKFALMLRWPDGTTAIPLRGLDRVTADEYVEELQPEYDSEGNGTTIQVIPDVNQ